MGAAISSQATSPHPTGDTPIQFSTVVGVLGAVVEAQAALGLAALKQQQVGFTATLWSETDKEERGKRFGGALLRCKGEPPRWAFVPPSRPLHGGGLRVALAAGVAHCNVWSVQDLNERVDKVYFGVFADPDKRPPLGLDAKPDH